MRDLYVVTSKHFVETPDADVIAQIDDELEVRLMMMKHVMANNNGHKYDNNWSYFQDGMDRDFLKRFSLYLDCVSFLNGNIGSMVDDMKQEEAYITYEDLKNAVLFHSLHKEYGIRVLPRYTEDEYNAKLTDIALGCQNGSVAAMLPVEQHEEKARGILQRCDKSLRRRSYFDNLPTTFDSAFTALVYVRDYNIVRRIVYSTPKSSDNSLLFMGSAHPLTCLADGTFKNSFKYISRVDINTVENEIVVSGNLPVSKKIRSRRKSLTSSGKKIRFDLRYDAVEDSSSRE